MKPLNFLFLICLTGRIFAQSNPIVLVNGGIFGNNAENVNISIFYPDTGEQFVLDTIHTQSAQDLLIEDDDLYVAAQDSIIKYNLNTRKRLAATAFNAPSTVKILTFDNYLFVGNYYLPWGWIGNYTNNLRIYNKHNLEFLDSIPEILLPAKDFAIVGDSMYVTQNYSSSNFTDSAGYFAVIDLNQLEWKRNILFNSTEELGRLLVIENDVFALNPYANTILRYHTQTNSFSRSALSEDIDLSTYGTQWAFDEQNPYILAVPSNGALSWFNLLNLNFETPFIESNITALTYDPNSNLFYATDTDFFSYSRGFIFDAAGNELGNFSTGHSPELLAVWKRVNVGTVDVIQTSTELNVFPNPSESYLNFPTLDSTYCIDVFSTTGSHILHTCNVNQIDVHQLNKGAYFIKITSGGKQYTARFTKL